MNKKVLHEFATPILVSQSQASTESRDALNEFLRGVIASDAGTVAPRSQEVVGISPKRGFGGAATPVALHRSKFETHGDLHERADHEMRRLLLEIIDLAQHLMMSIADAANDYRPYVMNCWASSYAAGDYHLPHIHPGVVFSAVYCAESPNSAMGEGALVLHDPRPNIGYSPQEWPAFSSDARILTLAPGEIVLFPGWLTHSVTPFRGPGRRLTVSVNLGVKLMS